MILDLLMPGIDGLDACCRIETAAPDVDIIVCTAADDPAVRAAALEAGVSALVSKFRVADDLVPAIQRTNSVKRAAV